VIGGVIKNQLDQDATLKGKNIKHLDKISAKADNEEDSCLCFDAA
jgi:hypothetical protein